MSRLLALFAVFAMAMMVQPSIADAQTLQLPCRFHGEAQWDCQAVPDGTVVTAEIGGQTYTALTTGAIYGESTYDLLIVPSEGIAYDDGTPVYFTIGDRDAIQIGHWEAGGNVHLDLTDQCTRVRKTFTYVSAPGDPVAVSPNGIAYGPSQSAVAAWVFPGYPTIEGATWISSSYVVEDRWKTVGEASRSGSISRYQGMPRRSRVLWR